jgi:NAD(P)-dependent dehydrogenase (short-subunit alcohol dehydrogenase family)
LFEPENLLSPKPFTIISAVFVKVNVAVEDDIKKAVELAESQFGALHICFNNAGTNF